MKQQTTNEKRQSTRKASQLYKEAFFNARLQGVPVWFIRATIMNFWNADAFALFGAAQMAGIISYDEDERTWIAGSRTAPKITKGRLAYFCKRASRALNLNNGAHTNWKPFEWLFNYKPKTMRLYLHNVEECSKSKLLEDSFIDGFFDNLEANMEAFIQDYYNTK